VLDIALTFGIRVLSAGLVFGLQVLLARLMDLGDYGAYVTFWTWLIALGSFGALGFAESAVRFLPRYRARGREALAASFWRAGFVAVVAGSGVLAAAAVTVGLALHPADGPGLIVLLVGLGLPFLAMEFYLEGIARSFGWFRLTTVPIYIIRPLAIAGICLGLAASGVAIDLATVGAVVVGTMAAMTITLALVIALRLRGTGTTVSAVPRGQARLWLLASLPLLVISGLEDLVTHSDILILSVLLAPEEVGIYFAAARTLALAGFIHFAVQFVAGRGFALALADRDRTQFQDAVSRSSRLTFWSTLVALAATVAAGPLLLGAFGPEFAAGYPVMAVLAAGLLAKAASGQAGEVLVVTGRWREGLWLGVLTLAANVALILLLVPAFGMLGAAAGASLAMALRTVAIVIVVRQTTGIRMVALGLPALARSA
jgi:O-antigen/teichoic acid export membrane protein